MYVEHMMHCTRHVWALQMVPCKDFPFIFCHRLSVFLKLLSMKQQLVQHGQSVRAHIAGFQLQCLLGTSVMSI